MKRILLAGLCLIVSGHGLFAQNKTLGVGVATPNPNAALHVESPTGNQGFIMPRMTTAQRFSSSFTSVLNATDKGLMVFDTDLNTIFIWNGSSWQNTGDVAGGVKLTFPYMDSVTSGTGTNDLIAFKYNAAEPKRILRVENHSTTNGSSALSVFNAGTGLSGYFQVANPASSSSTLWATTNSDAGGDLAPVAIYGESTGIGSLGGSFRTQNPANPHPALFAESKGTGNAILAVTSTGFSAIMGEVGGGVSNGVSGVSNSPEVGSFAVLGANNGGGAAGVFDISNNTNNSTALESRTVGLGRAARFSINNSNSGAQALSVESNGTGPVAFVRRTNTASNIPALYIDAQSGGGVRADNAGTNGYAAIFQNVNSENTTAALYAEAGGNGPSMWALKSTDAIGGDAFKAENWIGSGSAAIFDVTDVNNGSATINSHTAGLGSAGFFDQTNTEVWAPALVTQTAGQGAAFSAKALSTSANANAAEFVVESAQNPRNAVMAHTQGMGSAGNFSISNASSGAAALYAATDGTGAAFQATTSSGFSAVYGRREGATNGNAGLFEIVDAGNSYPALQANTSGTGSAANFHVSNITSTTSAVFAATEAVNGKAMEAANNAGGIAFGIVSGGVKVVSVEITSGTSLTPRASAYRITGGGPFSLGFTPEVGEVFMIYNESGANITVSGVTINDGTGKMLVVFPGDVIRGF